MTRGKKERCGECRYWTDQRCHRHAPTSTEEDRANWPITSEDDQCGDFQKKETGRAPQVRVLNYGRDNSA